MQTPSIQNKIPAALVCLSIIMLISSAVFFFREEESESFIVIVDEPVTLPEFMPDFGSILDVNEKKETFFDFMEPFVDDVNARIMQERQRLLGIMEELKKGGFPEDSEMRFLSTLSEKYELDTDDLLDPDFLALLLRRVDKIPASLALAQAANESAWGASRFAQDGKNFFGQWCYIDGCGIVPRRRVEGATYEVRSFESVIESVESYIHNLNTFPSYQMLRRIRQQLRQQNLAVDGVNLADGLESYSARGLDYVAELQRMIYSNDLLERDNHEF